MPSRETGKSQDHAVVIGGSIAGLLAGRVLADHFERVTVVERDLAPATSRPRKGVPQSRHPHLLLAQGQRAIDTIYPGFSRQLAVDGAVACGDYYWYRFGRWSRLEPLGVPMYSHSHPFLEQFLRTRLAALPQVRFVHGNVLAPFLDEQGTRVAGVRIENREQGRGQSLAADVVVDASGRGSRSPQWLDQLGFARPRSSSVEIDLSYSSCLYTLPSGERDWQGMVIVEERPDSRRTAGLVPVEGDRWFITIATYHKEPAPGDHQGILTFLRSLPQPQLYQLIRNADPISEVQTRKLPGSLWRHYERLRHIPENYFVVGEALCSLNPISAAGVSVAALEAEALDEILARAPRHPARSYFRRIGATIATAWMIATSEDFAFGPTRGKRPPGIRLLNWYQRRAFLAGAENKLVQRRALEVINLLKSPWSLLWPDMMLPVLTSGRAPGQGEPPLSRAGELNS